MTIQRGMGAAVWLYALGSAARRPSAGAGPWGDADNLIFTGVGVHGPLIFIGRLIRRTVGKWPSERPQVERITDLRPFEGERITLAFEF
ncbi:MAG TPA: hypothetical protein DDW98_02850 [Gammaproteobacteria bacterium]|jgi:hypothetical protein|nr:hypothetical protein [Gammaproteobacteria bacterium]HBG50473.1 hypothetical protein [Gammaproteobacteria bacterium]